MEEFALIKSRVNLNRVNLGIALISDLKVYVTICNKIVDPLPPSSRYVIFGRPLTWIGSEKI